MTQINGVEFTPQEVEAVAIALDRMENEEEDHAASILGTAASVDDEYDQAARASYLNEAAVARAAREKWSQVRREART